MITEIRKNLYKIEVPLKGNPLGVLNSYYIKADDKELVIDTGFQTADCLSALKAALEELGSVPEHRDVLVTHMHSDHIGNAHLIRGEGRTIYISDRDRQYMTHSAEDKGNELYGRFLSEGFDPAGLQENAEKNDAWQYDVGFEPEEAFTRLHEGDKLIVGDYTLEVINVPGHSAGQIMLWDERDKIMFTGDHVLFDITPNITFIDGFDDALGSYIESLKKADTYPVELALPAHRHTGDYHARIAAILKHHEIRIAEAYDAVASEGGLTAVQIASHLSWDIRARSWDDFPPGIKWFAVGEALSHLDYLLCRKKIKKEMQNGVWRYFIAD